MAYLPNLVNKSHSFSVTVDKVMFGKGQADVKLENSSIIVNKYVFFVIDVTGPLKSILKRSIGAVAVIKCTSDGLQNWRFISAQIGQDTVIF